MDKLGWALGCAWFVNSLLFIKLLETMESNKVNYIHIFLVNVDEWSK